MGALSGRAPGPGKAAFGASGSSASTRGAVETWSFRRTASPVVALLWICTVANCGPPALENRTLLLSNNALDFSVTLNGASGQEALSWTIDGQLAWVEWTGTQLEEGSFSVEISDALSTRLYRESARLGVVPLAASCQAKSGDGPLTLRLAWTGASGLVKLKMRGVQ